MRSVFVESATEPFSSTYRASHFLRAMWKDFFQKEPANLFGRPAMATICLTRLKGDAACCERYRKGD
jgi:hypothetical protein